jgi:hypothetical protein
VALTWFMNVVASLTRAGVEDVKNPLQSGRTREVSPMLVPVMALFFVMLALAMDALFDTNRGSRVVVGAHLLFAIPCAIGVVMDIGYIRGHTGAN